MNPIKYYENNYEKTNILGLKKEFSPIGSDKSKYKRPFDIICSSTGQRVVYT